MLLCWHSICALKDALLTIRFGTVGSPKKTPKSGSPAAVRFSRELGLGALELGWVRSVRTGEKTAAEIKEAGIQADIRLSVHAPYYINLNSQTADKMQASDERLLAAARKGYLSGATHIVFHPGSYHEQPAEQVYERVKEKLIELTATLKDEGVDVKLCPETMGKPAMFGTLEEVVALSKELDAVEPCIDVAHLFARTTTGDFNTYPEFAGMFEHVKQELGAEALTDLHFHLSGIEYGDKGEKNHIPLDEGELRWQEFLQACVDYEIGGAILIESPTMEDDALKAQAAYLEKLKK